MLPTYVSDWKFACSSSRRNCTSSTTSSSDHLRPQRFLAKGSSWATSIAGRFAEGAFVTRFYTRTWFSQRQILDREDRRTLKVATMTRMTFSFTASCAVSMRRGMTSYFLEPYQPRVWHIKNRAYLLICSATSCSNESSQKQKATW